jgi:Uma2 family endonuclease
MTWDEVCNDISLQDLPYKIETNGIGQIIMSPHNYIHTWRQVLIQDLLKDLLTDGHAMGDTAIQTSDGVRSPDVVWISKTHHREHLASKAKILQTAPAICVEVISESNLQKHMLQKMKLHFEKGAKEVWLCDKKGRFKFYSPNGLIPQSELCPDFPQVLVDE